MYKDTPKGKLCICDNCKKSEIYKNEHNTAFHWVACRGYFKARGWITKNINTKWLNACSNDCMLAIIKNIEELTGECNINSKIHNTKVIITKDNVGSYNAGILAQEKYIR